MHVFTETFWQAVVGSIVFWFIALLLVGLSFVFLDKVLLKQVHVQGELNKGNMAVALVVSAFLVGMALVIFGVTN